MSALCRMQWAARFRILWSRISFLEVKGSQASFMATNLNLTIRCVCEVSVEEEGQIALPTKVIGSIVRDLPNGDVVFFV